MHFKEEFLSQGPQNAKTFRVRFQDEFHENGAAGGAWLWNNLKIGENKR